MRMPSLDAVPPRPDGPRTLPVRWWIAWASLGAVAAGVVGTLVVLARGHRLSVGHTGLTATWGASLPSPTLGAMVTMVGPLGITFPCWAAGRLHRPKAAVLRSAAGPRP